MTENETIVTQLLRYLEKSSGVFDNGGNCSSLKVFLLLVGFTLEITLTLKYETDGPCICIQSQKNNLIFLQLLNFRI